MFLLITFNTMFPFFYDFVSQEDKTAAISHINTMVDSSRTNPVMVSSVPIMFILS
jgi:hypothetical protein